MLSFPLYYGKEDPMDKKKSATLMTEGSIAKALFRFSMPILLGNIFQQLYNTADALIVGNYLGNTSLAAVTSVGTVVWLLIGLFGGFSQGSGVIIARYFGSGNRERLEKAVATHILLSVVSGLIITAAGVRLSPLIIRLMNTPENVMAQSEVYLKIYFAGGLGLAVYNGCTGLMQAVGDSRHPLYYLIFSSCINVVLDILFIRGFGMGVEGAALATIIAQFVSAILCMKRLFTTEEVYRVDLRTLRFDGDILKLIFKYGTPAALQNAVTSFANTMLQANINVFGDMAMGGLGAVSKIEGFMTMPTTSLSTALATFTSQNLGAEQSERAKKGAIYGTLSAIAIAVAGGIVMVLFGSSLIRLFTKEPEAVAYGMMRIRIVAGFYFALAATHALAGVMRGAGKPMVTMIAFVGFWCVLRIFILSVLVPIYHSIELVIAVFPITWSLSTLFLVIYAFKGNWLHPKDMRE